MAEMSRNAETTKIYSASLRVAILICDFSELKDTFSAADRRF